MKQESWGKIEKRYPIVNSLSQSKREAAEFGYNLAQEEYAAQSTQEGGTVEGVLQASLDYNSCGDVDYFFPQRVKDAVTQAMTEYASQVSATDKKRIEELEKEVERLRGLVGDSVYDIDFSGHVKARIVVNKQGVRVEAAMSGYGDGLHLDGINIEKVNL